MPKVTADQRARRRAYSDLWGRLLDLTARRRTLADSHARKATPVARAGRLQAVREIDAEYAATVARIREIQAA